MLRWSSTYTFGLLWLIIGSEAFHLNALKQDHLERMKQYDAKIRLAKHEFDDTSNETK
ncbi:mitochondrial F1-FO ATP synthase peripheral stalk assembly factor Ina22 [Schizosaccharomyces pombe]|uniref:Uncharacterized protein new9 n=1 Tax=Schizosaccharomyces pombe (strain 972 / ATCC 24843) TaxID=284812 RepID=NEW9_SCHPO|nr:protein new9 [Schizosaccharomyces pombe]G2TRN2.1 RecName: Full=Uncharacterized protein new9 [Schizosaccharomyces pombe 972h-]CCD31334.1 sequence orphan [Schizosaccharomyces pombe]|eukprot:NP_001343124.1 protein new9 [Schizosaccharomyces pombe]